MLEALSTKIQREEVSPSPELRTLRRTKNTDYAVWWPLGFIKNPFGHELPHIEMLFREVRGDDTLGAFFSQSLAVTSLPMLAIGSIWSNGRSTSQIRYKRKRFTLDFSADGYGFVSIAESGVGTVFSPSAYLLRNHKDDRSKLLRFRSAEGSILLVPASVFLARCYGRSGRLTRLLTQYHLDVCLPMMCSPAAESTSDRWELRLHPGMYRDDALILGHLLFDDVASRRAKHLFLGLQNSVSPASRKKVSGGEEDQPAREEIEMAAYPEVHPWWQGSAQLEVEGVEVDQQTFLGLRITGMTQPDGPRIEIVRDQSLTQFDDREDEDGENGTNGYVRRQFQPSGQPSTAELTDNEAPTHSAGTIEYVDPTMRVLGVSRDVTHRVRLKQTEPGAKTIPQETPSDRASAAARQGAGAGGASYASHHSDIELESHGTLRNLWEGLKFLAREHPEQVLQLGWFTHADSIVDVNPIDVTASLRLEPLRMEEGSVDGATGGVQTWGYLDVERRVPRGILVARVVAPDRQVFVLDVQRRTVPVGVDGDAQESKNDQYSGLVIALGRPVLVDTWLPRVLQAIRDHRGVMKKVLSHCPGSQKTDFHHRPAKGERVAGHAAALNALRKGGVVLPPIKPIKTTESAKEPGGEKLDQMVRNAK